MSMGRPCKIKISEELENEVIKFYLLPSSARETQRKFSVNLYQLKKILLKHSIELHDTKTIKVIRCKKLEETLLERFGVSSTFKSEEIKQKIKQTNLERYGCEYAMQNKELQLKAREQCIKNHNGRTDVGQFGSIEHLKWREYCEYLDKIKQTCLEKYGVESYTKTLDYKEKSKQTCLEYYGTENYTKTSSYKEKSKQTCLKKYGVENPMQSIEILNKSIRTRKENKTLNSSQQEKIYAIYLKNKFGAENVFEQYKEDRYPFVCDFYIKTEDLFIELNLSWTHGPHQFNEDNKEDISLLENWSIKAKTSKYYKNAINTWTVRDVRKTKIAKENSLNYKTIYWDEWKQILKEISQYE